MKKIVLLGALIAFYFAGSAQNAVSKDSLNALKLNKDISDMNLKISKTKIELAKETNNLNQLQNEYLVNQQKAVDATNLSNSLSTTAGDVNSSKKALDAAKNAAKMNKKVSDTQGKILKSQKRINDYNNDLTNYNSQLQTMQIKQNVYLPQQQYQQQQAPPPQAQQQPQYTQQPQQVPQ